MTRRVQRPVETLRPLGSGRNRPSEASEAFERFSASELYCPKCKQPVPVREKMLLFLPGGELYDYTCPKCGTSVGTRKT